MSDDAYAFEAPAPHLTPSNGTRSLYVTREECDMRHASVAGQHPTWRWLVTALAGLALAGAGLAAWTVSGAADRAALVVTALESRVRSVETSVERIELKLDRALKR